MEKQEVCRNLINCLKSAIGLLDIERDSPLRKDTIAVCDYLDNSSFRIAVFGPFNYGKSTLLNAMLGQRTLPIDLIPTTGAAITVKYGNELHARIKMFDGTEINESGTDVLKQFAILDDNRRMRSDVEAVEVSCPHPFLQTGVELMDLPGTNDAEAQDNLVRDKLLAADLIVQVLDARKLMTLGERENLRDWLLDRGIKTVVFVVNFLNLLEPEDQKQVYNRLLFVAESFRTELPKGISNLYRVDALPALRARLKGDVSAAHSTGLAMFESALQNIVAVQQENRTIRIPRVVAIAHQVKQALLNKTQIITKEVEAAQEKRNAKIQIQQKAEKLIKQGFQASVSEFQGWLYLPKLLERYQTEVARALEAGEFTTWEAGKFKQSILEHQQAIVKWVHQASEFFNRPQLADLWISFPDPPEVILPNKPTHFQEPSNTSPVGIVTELSQLLLETIGGAVVGGATYLFGKDTSEEKPASSVSTPSYIEQVKEAYEEAASDYLMRFNAQAMKALRQYEEAAEKLITFKETDEPLETTDQHHQLQLLNNLLDILNQELEAVKAVS